MPPPPPFHTARGKRAWQIFAQTPLLSALHVPLQPSIKWEMRGNIWAFPQAACLFSLTFTSVFLYLSFPLAFFGETVTYSSKGIKFSTSVKACHFLQPHKSFVALWTWKPQSLKAALQKKWRKKTVGSSDRDLLAQECRGGETTHSLGAWTKV